MIAAVLRMPEKSGWRHRRPWAPAFGAAAAGPCPEAGMMGTCWLTSSTTLPARSAGDGLSLDGPVVRCPHGHGFDVARQGYVSLLTGSQAPGTADSTAMVAAREAFLGAGHFDPLAEAVARRLPYRGEGGRGRGRRDRALSQQGPRPSPRGRRDGAGCVQARDQAGGAGPSAAGGRGGRRVEAAAHPRQHGGCPSQCVRSAQRGRVRPGAQGRRRADRGHAHLTASRAPGRAPGAPLGRTSRRNAGWRRV